ncbi:hypothetical protein GV791_26690 [Nocardia cyriacigeorgica]|uniref:Helicase-associated domain-containing protein n=1 Tax=Nocardia cyriacigeorgica TaxID=135487 RepID=A0A6P1D0P6_9NOCA|nr:helicase associated domain-containing protein [Nocardia cyriacigeorgica]MBF6425660.1 helicase associated domain-containing protein [Nocardia cyriacigeorgica]NEW36125.1 hypothetical protein [Nocardia cyriacigeorgica]
MARRDARWWAGWLAAIEEFRTQHGHTAISATYRTPDGRHLGAWISARRRDFRHGKLDAHEVEMLAAAGVDVRVHGAAARQATSAANTRDQWEERIAALDRYRDEFGHVDVPLRYVSPDGFRLGRWLQRCRGMQRQGRLPAEREAALVQRGVEFDLDTERWLWCLGELAAFRNEHGHGNVPHTYRASDGYLLGSWLHRCRQAHRDGTLADYRAAALRALGVDLGLSRSEQLAENLETWLRALAAFREEHGHVRVPVAYVTSDGRKLGSWLATCRTSHRKGTLPVERTADLTALGVELNGSSALARRTKQEIWDGWLEALSAYRSVHGDLDVPRDYVTPLGAKLGEWLHRCRAAARQGKLPPERRIQLRQLGVALPRRNAIGGHSSAARRARWRRGITALRKFAGEHGHANPSAAFVDADGFRVGGWLTTKRQEYRAGKLTDAEIAELTSLGARLDTAESSNKNESWQEFDQARWDEWIQLLTEYVAEHGNAYVANSYVTPAGDCLGMWLSNCRRWYRDGTLRADRRDQLIALGADLVHNGYSLDERWNRWIRALTAYIDEHHKDPPGKYKTPDGLALGQWLATQRMYFRKGKLSLAKEADLRRAGATLNRMDGRKYPLERADGPGPVAQLPAFPEDAGSG